MLANTSPNQSALGALDPNCQPQDTSLYRLLDFIASQLPIWRDDPEREPKSSEQDLNDQLCSHLNAASRHSTWDFLQFRTEVPDESTGGRSIDLSPKPCTRPVWINGRRYTKYQALLPIECKRLPTPKGTQRDDREYVYSAYGLRGGMQRFKQGVHGAVHNLAAMVGYIQEQDCAHWQGETYKSFVKEVERMFDTSDDISRCPTCGPAPNKQGCERCGDKVAHAFTDQGKVGADGLRCVTQEACPLSEAPKVERAAHEPSPDQTGSPKTQ